MIADAPYKELTERIIDQVASVNRCDLYRGEFEDEDEDLPIMADTVLMDFEETNDITPLDAYSVQIVQRVTFYTVHESLDDTELDRNEGSTFSNTAGLGLFAKAASVTKAVMQKGYDSIQAIGITGIGKARYLKAAHYIPITVEMTYTYSYRP